MTEATATQQVIVVGTPKSVGISVLLTIFLGPIGMLYSTVTGAIVMVMICAIAAVLTFGFGLLLTWPICVLWGALAASSHNKRLTSLVPPPMQVAT